MTERKIETATGRLPDTMMDLPATEEQAEKARGGGYVVSGIRLTFNESNNPA
jgi:hypothetical protein